MMKEIRLASTAAVLNVVEKLPDEKLDGVATYHYRVKFNIPKMRAYVERIFEIVNYSSTEEGQAMLDRVMKEAENARGELWIGKRDSLLYRTTIEWPFHYALPENDESADINISLTINNSKFNEPVTVTAPPDARDQQEFMQKLLGSFLGGLLGGLPATGDRELDNITSFTSGAGGLGTEASNGQAALGTTDQDEDGLTGAQEKFWGSDPENPDTDHDGYLDGAEVDNGYSPTGPGRLF